MNGVAILANFAKIATAQVKEVIVVEDRELA